jgi:protein TonB
MAQHDPGAFHPPQARAGGGERGTSMVALTIDRAGRVLSVRPVGSSGDAALDQEAVAVIRRASPVPPPPPNVGGGGSILLALPVKFGD